MRICTKSITAILTALTLLAFTQDMAAQRVSSTRRSSSVTRSDSQNKRQTTAARPGTSDRDSYQRTRPSTTTRPATVTRPSTSRSSSSTVRTDDNKRRTTTTSRPSGDSRPTTATKPSTTSGRPATVTKPDNRADKTTKPATTNGRPTTVTKPATDNDRPATNNGRPATVTRPATDDRPNRKGYNVGGHKGNVKKPDMTKHRPGDGPYPLHHKKNHPRVHPKHRDYIPYNKPSYFWTRHNHCYGHRVRVIPSNYVVHRYWGIDYYCYNNIWYRPYMGYYIVCRPPFGTVLAANLIADMAWTAVRLSYYNTVAETYEQINENNEYIVRQNETIAQNNAIIASQNSQIAANAEKAAAASSLAGQLGLLQSYGAAKTEYYYQDGIFYTQASNGEYTVIVPPAGALVEELPEDYEEVTLNGNQYYKVDNTIFQMTISGGKPYFEVLGQLPA